MQASRDDSATKRCPRCGQTKSVADYYKKENGSPQSWCKACNNQRHRERYWADPEAVSRRYYDARIAADPGYVPRRLRPTKGPRPVKNPRGPRGSQPSREELKAQLDGYKMERGCADCGTRIHPIILDFDHLPGFEKRKNVSELLKSNYSARVVWDEVAKCEVVCSNCHRLRGLVRLGVIPMAAD